MYRKLGTITLSAAGATGEINLPTSQFLRSLQLLVTVNVTNDAGGATINEDGLARCLRFRYYRGSEPDLDMGGQALKHYTESALGKTTRYTEIPAAGGAQAGTWRLPLWRADPGLVVPERTADDMRLGTNPRLQVTLGATADYTATANCTLNSCTIEVSADLAEIQADLPTRQFTVIRQLIQKEITDLATSASDEAKKVNPGAFVRRFMLMVRNRAAPKARNDSRVSELQLYINDKPRGIIKWGRLQDLNDAAYRIAMPTGIAFIDYDWNRALDPRTMLDLRGAQSAELAFSTDGTACDVTVVQETVLLPTAEDLAILSQLLGQAA